jgi:hypothetical protein
VWQVFEEHRVERFALSFLQRVNANRSRDTPPIAGDTNAPLRARVSCSEMDFPI